MQIIWFHGTSRKNVDGILKNGFRKGTWFARHMEDAVTFGGPVVFFVKVTFEKTPMRWQVCSSNTIRASAIKNVCYVRTLRVAKH
jgi:hypothetical protein